MPAQPASDRKVKVKQAPPAARAAARPLSPARSLPLLAVGAGLFLLSAASLAFEVTLTHLFSLVFQYHFAFLAVSCAILGLGAGGAAGALLPAPSLDKAALWLGQAAALFALALPISVVLFAMLGFTPGILLQALLGALPFAAIGFFSASVYTFYSQKAAWLYAFDLAGAAAGLIGVQLLLNWASAASVGLILGLLAGAASLIFILRLSNRPWLAFIALGLGVIALGVNLTSRAFDLPTASADSIPPDKTMFSLLADPSSGSKLLGSAWSAFARVDLLTSSDPNQDYIFTNGGAGSYMLRFNGDLSSVQGLKSELEYIPFEQFSPQKTLILGSGAGKDVLQALLAGSKQVTAVEINPAMVALTRQYGDYNGNIYDYPGVQAVVADGRNYLERSADTFNMIYLNLVYAQAPSPGSNALSESYVFTTQAFRTYWSHLDADGRLAIISHQGLEGTRGLLTALKALELDGIPAPQGLKHAALLMYNGSDPNTDTTLLILQKSPLSSQQVQVLEAGAQSYNLKPLFLPGVYESLLPDLTSGKLNVDQYAAHQDYNLFPTTDEQPFFFNVNPGIPAALVTLLIVAGAGLALYLLLGIRLKSRPPAWQLAYFAAIGLGFMLLEVPLIQRTILLVGSPTLAMGVVLAPLLLGGGLGSLWSSRWAPEKLWLFLAIAAAVIAALGALFAILQPALVEALLPLGSGLGALLAGLAILPLGFSMGIPFANGLRLAGQSPAGRRSQASLAYLWGWNALASVAGSALAAVVAMQAGFGAVMAAGAACYALVVGVAALWARKG